LSNAESQSNQESPESVAARRQLSADATLGLERLVVGRECNGFDRLSAERKALAYAELVRLGLIYGTVSPVAGRSYPDVTIQRVSRRGHGPVDPDQRKFKVGSLPRPRNPPRRWAPPPRLPPRWHASCLAS